MNTVILMVCQCPERGDLHFYFAQFPPQGGFMKSVNALKGATSISTGFVHMVGKNGGYVSMP